MTTLASLLEPALEHPDVGVIVLLGVYLSYEIRFGVISSVKTRQEEARQERRILGVAVYKVVKDDPELDESTFRDMLWGSDDDPFPEDLNSDAQARMRGAD